MVRNFLSYKNHDFIFQILLPEVLNFDILSLTEDFNQYLSTVKRQKMLYKYCTKYGFDILLKARLKAARIKDLNDPFELVFGVDRNTAFDNIKKEYEDDKNIINNWIDLLDDQKIEHDKTSIEDILKKIVQFQIKD